MKLSVIIVNYNVRFFLEPCLLSIQKSITQLNEIHPSYKVEIFVVDNNSVDNSTDMVKKLFPDVILLENKENKGFAAANNQAIILSRGEYVLLINPDTVIEEFTLQKTVEFMDSHNDAGAVGVKMIDGKGNFLPESKRSLPRPVIAFYKIFGFSRLFPKSRIFGRYHLGFLNKNEVHKVEVLTGAFMLVRKSVLEIAGYFDERFFMYGEDIDLSYRITMAGYTNYYFPGTQIIHYKGESTKKSSINYVFVFYRAMIIFAKKHFSKKNAILFSFFINMAIYIRASGALIHRFINKILLPVIDLPLVYFGLIAVKNYWEQTSFGYGYKYPVDLIYKIFPVYVILWMAGLFLAHGYTRPYRVSKIFKGVIIGTVFISVFYAFLQESYRFSRAIILIGTFSSFFCFLLSRLIVHFIRTGNFHIYRNNENRVAIVGHADEARRVLNLLKNAGVVYKFTGFIYPDENENSTDDIFIGYLYQIKEIINVNKINEIIFCDKDIPTFQVFDLMSKLQSKELVFRIAPGETLFVIGSNSRNNQGNFYTIDIQLSISKSYNKFYKRLQDICLSFLGLFFSPVLIWFQNKKHNYFKNLLKVLAGNYTFVSYRGDPESRLLPELKMGILRPSDQYLKQKISEKNSISECNMIYAKNYTPLSDFIIIIRNINNLGKCVNSNQDTL